MTVKRRRRERRGRDGRRPGRLCCEELERLISAAACERSPDGKHCPCRRRSRCCWCGLPKVGNLGGADGSGEAGEAPVAFRRALDRALLRVEGIGD